MPDPIVGVVSEAVGGSGPVGFGPVTIDAASLAGAEGPSPAGEAFKSLLESFQLETSGFEKANAPASDPVATAKAEFTGAAEAGSAAAVPGAAAATGEAGLGVLRKSFDHALFVTLVSQIVSGVSQSATTLVKQQ